MLINISNHPFAQWSKRQQHVAVQQYGEVVDLPFPPIDPLWNAEQILKLAQQYFDQCQQLQATRTSPITVHLMGEFTFCFALTVLLQRAQIPVVASTTHRKVVENADGTITRTFEFVQFRPYPPLCSGSEKPE